jgi:DNA repair protein RadD
LLALPTGTGKSLVLAELMRSTLLAYPGTRILALTHVKELIEQNYSTLLRRWPGAQAGIFSAGLGRKDLGHSITFGGIASIRDRARAFSRTNVVLIDEAHLVSDKADTMYQEFLAELRTYNPALKVIGLTATPYRLGQGKLTDGGLFQDLVFDLTSGDAFLWLIDQGYLCNLYPKSTGAKIDLKGIGTTAGEFNSGQLDAAIRRQGIIRRAIEETCQLAGHCRSWLVFCDSIPNAENAAAELASRGVAAACIHSKLPASQRDELLAAYRGGKLRALVNVGILTTGFDHPHLDCIVLLRPTQSPGLHVQICGRGTRPVYGDGFDLQTQTGRLAAIAAGPKPKGCLVLDFACNTERLGPINWPTIPKKRGKGDGTPPVRECEVCGTYNHISVRFCIFCGTEMPRQEKLLDRASSAKLIARKADFIKVHPVSGMYALRHQKPERPDSVRVSYQSGSKSFTTYVGVEHEGYMRRRSEQWWNIHRPFPDWPVPPTTTALLETFPQCRVPKNLKVNHADEYPEIIDYDFAGHAFNLEPQNG